MSTATLSAELKNGKPLKRIEIPGNPSNPTRTRWVLNGVLDGSGNRVKLQAWKVGGRLYTSDAAVERFLQRLNADAPASEADDAAERIGTQAGAALQSLGY